MGCRMAEIPEDLSMMLAKYLLSAYVIFPTISVRVFIITNWDMSDCCLHNNIKTIRTHNQKIPNCGEG